MGMFPKGRDIGEEAEKKAQAEAYLKESRMPWWLKLFVFSILALGLFFLFSLPKGTNMDDLVDGVLWEGLFYKDLEIPLQEMVAPLVVMGVVGAICTFFVEWFRQGKSIHPKIARAVFLGYDFLRHRINAFRQWRIVMAARGFAYSANLSICRVRPLCDGRPIGIVYFKTAKGESRKMKFCSECNPLEGVWSKTHFRMRRWEITGTFFFEKSLAHYHDGMF